VCVERPNVLLLSSVLQYLPKPYDVPVDPIRQAFDYVIVDRTAFCSGRDRLTAVRSAWTHPAVYPARLSMSAFWISSRIRIELAGISRR
jgi:hypothetical protein